MSSSDGFLTRKLRREFIKFHGLKETPDIISLDADDNTSERIYFWQLYSILGEDGIAEIITTFYTDVLNDPVETIFRDTFRDSGTLDYHVKKQVDFWVDVTGGGKRYPGGEARLELHHDNAKIIMNNKGASRWLFHMKNAIDTVYFNDERIVPCLIDFINFFMMQYGHMYNFRSRL